MKKEIITLIGGFLIGAIVTTAIFLIARPKMVRPVPNSPHFYKNGERRGIRDKKSINEDTSLKEDENNINDEKQG